MAVVELLLETRHPFTITTKSDRVLRDLDLLKQAADLRIASVALSVTSLDPQVARTLEPRAPQPLKRFAAMKGFTSIRPPRRWDNPSPDSPRRCCNWNWMAG